MPQPTPATRPRLRMATACALCFFALSLVAKDFVKPTAQPARAYPAHDDHPTDKVAIAVDPYDTPEKAKIFSIEFHDHGFLPVFFVVTNDGDQPISIADINVELITPNRSRFTPSSTEDIYRRLSNPQANTAPTPLPFPVPHKKVKGTISKKEKDEIESSQFAARAVEPHTTQSGFLFFDVGGLSAPLAGAHFDITGVSDAKGNELLYFEIPLENYLNPRQKAN
jgi:hypothetical protein